MPTGSHLYPSVTFFLVLQQLKPTFVVQLTLLFHNLIRLIYGQFQRFQERGIVVTNASDGNTPHIVQDIGPDGALRTKPLAQAKPSDSFLRIDRNESVLGTFFSNMNRQYDRPSDFRFYHLPVEMLSTAKDLVEIFKFPKENEQLLSSYCH